jgi:PAS domain S-box-containing protein
VHDIGDADLLRWFMRSTTDGLWICDKSGRTVLTSDRLAEILGRTAEEMAGLTVADVLDAAGKDQYLAHVEELTSSQAGQDNLECNLVRKDGSRTWALVSYSPLLDDDGVRRGWLHRVAEITESVMAAAELAAARDAAMEASKMKSELLVTMSHEIRTPLNGVLGLTDLLLRTDLTPAQERLANGVAQSGRALLVLIEDILDFSNVEAGKLELEAVDFEVRVVVDQAVALMAEAARRTSVRLVVACGEDVPCALNGDPVRFGQVLTNLVSNAVKLTHEGKVTIRVSDEGQRADSRIVRVEVSDDGIGVAPEAQANLFDSFTQADACTTREYGGTGLGLAISRLLVDALGGEIGFTSEVGIGSTFWFTAAFLPAPHPPGRVSDAAVAVAAEPPAEPDWSSSRGAVLVAEDNVVNQMVARGVLEGLGYTVEFAHDGLQAVAAMTQTPGRFVAVLMDCQMPQLDGYEATRVVRQLEHPDARVPVIAMTASTALGERERCLAAGMDDFLMKPIDFGLLESTLGRWVGGEPSPDGDTQPDPDASGLLDLTRIRMLHDLRPGDPSLIQQFVDTFVAKAPDDAEAIASAVRVADHSRLMEAAHRLKGSAQNLGAVEVGRLCEALENAGGRRDAFEAADLVPVLERQLELTVQALRAWVDDAV